MSNRILCLGGLLAAAVVYFAMYPIGFDPNSACVGNARILNIALQEYVYDYDEQLPPMQSPAAFQSSLNPYIDQPSRFVCPDTGRHYRPHSAISGFGVAVFSNTGSVIAFMDAVPHTDGQKMISYLDGHVTFGGVVQGDPTQLCIDNVKQLAFGLDQYAQDYDNLLPVMQSQGEFETAIKPYVPDGTTYVCPVTNRLYAPNLGVSGKSLSQLPLSSTIGLEDSVPHPDGLRTIGYLDGHVVHGTLGANLPTDPGNLAAIGRAYEGYLEDNAGKLPPLSSYSQFESALLPYVEEVQQDNFTQPSSGMDYVLDSSVNGENISQISDPAGTPIASDPVLNPDGSDNTLYADGHVGTLDYNIAQQITAGPESGSPALVWSNAAGGATIDDLSASGAVTAQFAYRHPVAVSVAVERSAAFALANGFMSYEQANNETLPPLDSYAAFESAMAPYVPAADLVSPGNGLPYDLDAAVSGESLAAIDDPSTTWLFKNSEPNSDGTVGTGYADGHVDFSYAPNGSASSDFGVDTLLPVFQPFYPPVLTQVSTTSSNRRQLLWGSNEIWSTDYKGAVASKKFLGPYDGWTSIAIASNGSLRSRMLLRNDDGELALWTLNALSGYSGDVRLSPTPMQTPVGLVLGADGQTRILLSEANAGASVWTVSSAGAVVAEHNYTGPSGAVVAGIAIDSANVVRLLWNGSDGSAQVWSLSASGSVASTVDANIGPGWTASQLAIDGKGDSLILWKQPGGAATLESLSSTGSLVYSRLYTPYL